MALEFHCFIESHSKAHCNKSNDKSNPSKNTSASSRTSILDYLLIQEVGKKSSFLLNYEGKGYDRHSSDKLDIRNGDMKFVTSKKPSEIQIKCLINKGETIPKNVAVARIVSSTTSSTFLFGGIEIISNSRNIEAYTTDEKGKESYLITSRGIRLHGKNINETNDRLTHIDMACDQSIQWYKCVIVHPGGPSAITNIKLKLLSLQSPKDNVVLQYLKLTGKLPPSPPPIAELPATPKLPTPSPIAQNILKNEHPITRKDLQDVLSTFTIMFRHSEERILSTTTKLIVPMQEEIFKLQAMNKDLKEILMEQNKKIDDLQNQLTQKLNDVLVHLHNSDESKQCTKNIIPEEKYKFEENNKNLDDNINEKSNIDEENKTEAESVGGENQCSTEVANTNPDKDCDSSN